MPLTVSLKVAQLSRPAAPTDTLRVAPKAFWKVGCLLLALPSSSRQEEQTFPIAAFVSNRSTAVRQQQNTKKNKKKMISSTLQLVVSFMIFAFILLLFACCVSIALPSCCTAPALCPRRVSCYFYFFIFLP